jgi:hypothetical protein
MPIELCAELTPKILIFSELEDAGVKINSYLTLEVLFASRRFSNHNVDQNMHLVSTKTLKHLLDNNEILQNVSYQDVQVDEDGNEVEANIKVDKKDENRIIAYIQALTQVILNIATSKFGETAPSMDQDTAMKLVAASISVLSEYLIGSTWKIQKATTSAIRLIISHGLGKQEFLPVRQTTGFDKVYLNIKYLISERFQEQANNRGESDALGSSFTLIKAMVDHVHNPNIFGDEKVVDLLQNISSMKVNRAQYSAWTNCIGAFMLRLGANKFFRVLPLRLVEFDLNSLTYAQDSRSWLLVLIEKNLKIDANLDFYVSYFLPIILQLDKMRELEKKNKGSEIKIKKYETLLVQVWSLLPQFCMSNSPNLSDCFAQLLKFLEPIISKNLLGMRNLGLKVFSSLIKHCRKTKVVDEEIKKTRKGLINISMDYVNGLVQLYTQDSQEEKMLQEMAQNESMKAGKEIKAKFYRSEGQGVILAALQDFCSISKSGKLSNLFLTSFAQLVQQK